MQPPLLLKKSGTNLLVTLNRPNALNALTFEMCKELNKILSDSNSSKLLIVKGSGGKAFCAGGDVKACYLSIKSSSSSFQIGTGKPGELCHDFFREEYEMNHRIGTRDHIPQVSIWNGIVMGGGVGLSVHGKFRVASNNTVFAMPETALGLFPDVGGTYWLPRLNNGLGVYLGLTGARIYAYDLVYAGIATHFVEQQLLDDLETTLMNADLISSDAQAKVVEILDDFQNRSTLPDPSESVLRKHENIIHECFLGSSGTIGHTGIADDDTVEKIIDRLANCKRTDAISQQWIGQVLRELRSPRLSPKSLKLTLEGLKRGQNLFDLGECLKMEYRMMMACMRSQDFLEGVRSVLIDKDNSPTWKQDREDDIMDYFQSLGDNDLALDAKLR